jgi:hypothetical protein
MSVKVDLDQLSGALKDFAMAYLITVGDDFHAHTVAVDPVFAGGQSSVTSPCRATLVRVVLPTVPRSNTPPANTGSTATVWA